MFFIENALILVKPDYADNPNLIFKVLMELERNKIEIVECGYVTYNEQEVDIHYAKHLEKHFYWELRQYLLSGKMYGIHVRGMNVIKRARTLTEKLRINLKKQFNLETTLTKNILHCTNKTRNSFGVLIDEDSAREVKNFYNSLKRNEETSPNPDNIPYWFRDIQNKNKKS